MKTGQLRPLLPFLAAMAALPALTVAECCTCDFNGTTCSACCYSDQTPSCPIYNSGSVFHCGCYCEGSGGGDGGGIGHAGCSRIDSRLEVVGVERDREPRVKAWAAVSGQGLLNPGRRKDGVFNFEEWALVSPSGVILGASSPKFAGRVQALPDLFRDEGTSASLVIEDGNHPQNGREIPFPVVARLDIDAGLPAGAAGLEVWFRVEVGTDGVADQVVLLNFPAEFKSFWFNDRLQEHLKLLYADDRRHRIVVFGLLRADERGHLVLARSKVLIPKCCCNGRRCV